MKRNRLENSLKNIKVSLVSYIFTTILQFVNRSVFVHLLSSEYLGLNGLFTNVLSFLSLAELGIGGAMTYALYNPLKEGNIPLIKSLMALYKKAYSIIGCLVLVLGVSLAPFLSFFINEMPEDMPLLHVYYILYVANVGISYFGTYKRSILICDQKQYVSSITSSVKNICISFVQIVVLWTTHNYLLYLMVMVLCTIIENLIISKIAVQHYPFLNQRDVEPLPKEEFNRLKKNITAMFFHKIGSIIVTSTDNLIITKFVSLSMTGLYSNYTLVTNALNSVLVQIFNALTASIGNLVAGDDKKHDKRIFENILFGNYWIYSFCSVSMFCLFESFIQLWVGSDYKLGGMTVSVIVLLFYLTGMRKTVLIFRDATGIFWYDRFKAPVEATVNLVFSIPLAIQFGVMGTLLGTIISTLSVSFWVEAQILYKYHFKESCIPYLCKQGHYLSITVALALFTNIICNFVPNSGIIAFAIKAIICLIVPNAILIVLYFKTAQFNYYKNIIVNKMRKGN